MRPGFGYFIRQMKKLINIRPALVLAFAAGAGAGFAYLSAYNSVPLWWLIALVPVAAAFIIFFIIRGRVAGIVFSVVAALLFLYCSLGVSFRLSRYAETPLINGGVYEISGTVKEKSLTEDGEYVKIKNISADGEDVGGVMIVYLDEDYGQFCDLGYSIKFKGTVYAGRPFAYGNQSAYRLLEDIRYTAYPSGDISSEYGFSLFGEINSAVRLLYFDNLDKDTAAIAYAMFTGNTDFIETSTMDTFRYGGVAHVFAVSGMHIVLVYGIVSFILKKLRVSHVPAAIIGIALVFFYTGICGFTLSAVRAAIMCAVAAVVGLSGGKYDMLSSLGLAFVAVLIVNPLNIISVGFQLSVAAVAGIALFCGTITRALRRIKLPGKICSAAAMTLSAQIATFPILLSCFGYVSWASLVLNIIFVPLLSAIFTLQFALTLLSFVIPPAAFLLLKIFSVPLEAVTAFIVVAHAEQALISGFDFGVFAAPYFLAAYVISGQVNLKLRFRLIAVAVLAALIAVGMMAKNYIPEGGIKINASAYYGGSYCVLISSRQGSVLVISETPSAYDISSLLSENGVERPDAMIILGGDDSAEAYIFSGVECDDVYLNYTNFAFQPYDGTQLHYEKRFTVCDIEFKYVTGCDLYAKAGGISIGISSGNKVNISDCDILFSAAEKGGCMCGTCVYFDRTDAPLNLSECGDLQFTAKDGKIFFIGNTRPKGAIA